MAAIARDTIFAVASGAGRAAVTLLRVSGPKTGTIVDALARPRPEPRVASLRRLKDRSGETLDHALVLWFPGPHSYSGEDCAEFHLHGGRAVLTGVADALTDLGARPAEAGEFTMRAFLEGRLDLTAAEAVADLIDAETQSQRRQALRQLDGALGNVYRDWTERLVRLMAQQEALIDFPDEDLPASTALTAQADMMAIRSEIASHLDDKRRGERVREGLVFAVTGAPNVGKSTLINALSRRDVAIVANTPGTTRDILESRVEFGDVPVTLLDTAGLREPVDPIEAEGIRRARSRMKEADLIIHVLDATNPAEVAVQNICDKNEGELIVANKLDLAPCPATANYGISAATGAGLDILRGALDDLARGMTTSQGPAPLTRARHRAALTGAVNSLDRGLAAPLPELRAEDLRVAVRELGRITGRIGVEDILNSVFGQFCIGK